MTRIAYFVHGRGKGHAIRTRSVLASLGPGQQVRLFCAGDAWEVLGELPGAEPVLACQPGRSMLSSFALRFRGDLQRFRDWRPDLVVSDGDGPSVNAARRLGIPVLAVGHGLIFGHTRLGSSLPFPKRVREMANVASSSWPASRRIAVHFAPVAPRTPGTLVARPDLRTQVSPLAERDDFILAYFRDDNGILALEQLARRGHRVVLYGQPRHAPRGVEVQPTSLAAFAGALGRCRAVVGSAGNHLPAECAMLGLPMLALHRGDDAEHEMNARLVEDAGIGVAGAFERCTAQVIQRFEAELDKPRDELAARTRAMRPASEVVPEVIDALCAQGTTPVRRQAYGAAAASAR